MAPPRSWPMTLARVRPKWAQKAYRSLLPFRIPYPERGLSDSPKPLRSRVYTVKRCARRPASCSQMREEVNQPCTSTTAGPADDAVADPDALELHVLRVTGALYLPGVAPERDGGGEDHSNHNEQDYQCDAHRGHDSATTGALACSAGVLWSFL